MRYDSGASTLLRPFWLSSHLITRALAATIRGDASPAADVARLPATDGFADPPRGVRASCRRKSHPTWRIDDLGFRLARSDRQREP